MSADEARARAEKLARTLHLTLGLRDCEVCNDEYTDADCADAVERLTVAFLAFAQVERAAGERDERERLERATFRRLYRCYGTGLAKYNPPQNCQPLPCFGCNDCAPDVRVEPSEKETER